MTDQRCACGQVLSAEERFYYGGTCERCENENMRLLENEEVMRSDSRAPHDTDRPGFSQRVEAPAVSSPAAGAPQQDSPPPKASPWPQVVIVVSAIGGFVTLVVTGHGDVVVWLVLGAWVSLFM